MYKFMLLWTLCLIQSKKSTYLAVKQLYERGLSSDIHPRSLWEYNFSNTRSLWILIYREDDRRRTRKNNSASFFNKFVNIKS